MAKDRVGFTARELLASVDGWLLEHPEADALVTSVQVNAGRTVGSDVLVYAAGDQDELEIMKSAVGASGNDVISDVHDCYSADIKGGRWWRQGCLMVGRPYGARWTVYVTRELPNPGVQDG